MPRSPSREHRSTNRVNTARRILFPRQATGFRMQEVDQFLKQEQLTKLVMPLVRICTPLEPGMDMYKRSKPFKLTKPRSMSMKTTVQSNKGSTGTDEPQPAINLSVCFLW